MMDETWKKLYDAAMDKINPREISAQMYVGQVAAAVLTNCGNVYTGVCIDSSCSLGMCAERNALSSMLSNGENVVERVVSVYRDGKIMSPCGACREFMMHLGDSAKDIAILLDKDGKSVKLNDLMPECVY